MSYLTPGNMLLKLQIFILLILHTVLLTLNFRFVRLFLINNSLLPLSQLYFITSSNLLFPVQHFFFQLSTYSLSLVHYLLVLNWSTGIQGNIFLCQGKMHRVVQIEGVLVNSFLILRGMILFKSFSSLSQPSRCFLSFCELEDFSTKRIPKNLTIWYFFAIICSLFCFSAISSCFFSELSSRS